MSLSGILFCETVRILLHNVASYRRFIETDFEPLGNLPQCGKRLRISAEMQDLKRHDVHIQFIQFDDVIQGFLKQKEIHDDLLVGRSVRIVVEFGGINLVVITVGARKNGERQGAVGWAFRSAMSESNCCGSGVIHTISKSSGI